MHSIAHLYVYMYICEVSYIYIHILYIAYHTANWFVNDCRRAGCAGETAPLLPWTRVVHEFMGFMGNSDSKSNRDNEHLIRPDSIVL